MVDKTNAEGSYEVGKGKPPKNRQFKKGQSGNPSGKKRARPYASANEEKMHGLILEEAYRPISVTEGGKTMRIPLIQAVLRSLGVTAVKGNRMAQRDFVKFLHLVERDRRAYAEEAFKEACEYKSKWGAFLEQRAERGEVGPEPILHPDCVHLDFTAGKVTIKTPTTAEGRQNLDKHFGIKLEKSSQMN